MLRLPQHFVSEAYHKAGMAGINPHHHVRRNSIHWRRIVLRICRAVVAIWLAINIVVSAMAMVVMTVMMAMTMMSSAGLR